MTDSRFCVGIDLGTTHTALAYVDTRARSRRESRSVRDFPIPQLVRPGEPGERRELPSALYLPGVHELPAGACALPWDAARDHLAGHAALEAGLLLPDHLVSSAKSWLCNARVDRRAPILPWTAPEGLPRISPVEAATRLLRHLREAWDHVHRRHKDARFALQQLVLTVPASFDAVARALTVEAAQAAGLERVVLLEEPQAACYAWLAEHRLDWESRLAPGQRLLVCDVGGGTTDFSLLQVTDDGGALGLRRAAVGDHLLLGGDNLDLALARQVEAGWETHLDAVRLAALVAHCRRAKEALLAPDGPDEVRIALAGRGTRLVGGTLEATLSRARVLAAALDGFCPEVPLQPREATAGRGGLVEWGLPYEADPAITRHLADFLCRHGTDGPIHPDRLLFQGGWFAPPLLRERLAAIVGGWAGGGPIPTLASADLSLSVARGAAYHGLVLRGDGVRIGGGTPRGYYVGIGGADGERAVSLLPRGHGEHRRVVLREPPLALVIGQPVRFALYGSAYRDDPPGSLLDPDQLDPLPPIRSVLRIKKRTGEIPVHLEAEATEVGTLDLELVAEGGRRFALEFDLRAPTEPPPRRPAAPPGAIPAALDPGAACAALRAAFAPGAPEPELRRLARGLERTLARPRKRWPVAVLRALADELAGLAERRGDGPLHESRWLNLSGFCLRPGFGDPLDEHRLRDLWPAFQRGPRFPDDGEVAAEWWILWRRVAAGLGAGQQHELAKVALKELEAGAARRAGQRRPKVERRVVEQYRLAAALERIVAGDKRRVARLLFAELDGAAVPEEAVYWCLGRIGAREPFAPATHAVLPAEEVAGWVEQLAARPLGAELAFALRQLARRTGDRARDLAAPLRERVAGRLDAEHAEHARALREVVETDDALRGRVFGEALPEGLRLRDG